MGLERRSLAAAGRNPGMRAKDARQRGETEPTPPLSISVSGSLLCRADCGCPQRRQARGLPLQASPMTILTLPL